MGALEASPREFGSALEALWTRLERRRGVQGRPRETEMEANKHTITLKMISVTASGSDLVFNTCLIVFRVRRYSKVFKVYDKNVVILNIRMFHSQDMTMQTVFQTPCQHMSQIKQHLVESGALMVPDAI